MYDAMRAMALDDATRSQINDYVKQGLAELRQSMDVSMDDCRKDIQEWNRAEYDLRNLMYRAYVRNHNIPGVDA